MRPYILCHMMSSVDGRIVADRWSLPYDGTDLDTATQCYFDISNELKADAEILGRKTVQTDLVSDTFDHAQSVSVTHHDTFIGTRETERLCIVLDPKGKIRYTENTLMGENILVILAESVSETYVTHLQTLGISYLFAGPDGSDLVKAMAILHDIGIKKLLLQGGGIINGTFLKAGLIDELSLLIYPGIDGLAGIPSVFESLDKVEDNPAPGQCLTLLSIKEMPYGNVWLRYQFHRSTLTNG